MNKDRIIKQLQKTDKIIGRERYLNSAILISIANLNGEDCFIFQKRAKGIKQAGEISFPGGKYDKNKDNNFLETALRETEEEYGINKEKIEVLGYLGALIGGNNFIVEAFIGILKIKSLSEIKINENEVESLLVVPVNHFIKNLPEEYGFDVILSSKRDGLDLIPIKQLGLSKEYEGLRNIGKRKVFLYKYKDELIWGITAEIIKAFLKLY